MAKKDEAKELPKTPEDGHVRVTKDGEIIDVHHTTLDAHKSIGWKEVKLIETVEE